MAPNDAAPPVEVEVVLLVVPEPAPPPLVGAGVDSAAAESELLMDVWMVRTSSVADGVVAPPVALEVGVKVVLVVVPAGALAPPPGGTAAQSSAVAGRTWPIFWVSYLSYIMVLRVFFCIKG